MSAARNVSAVVKSRLCCGCGACEAVCPHAAVTIVEGRHYNSAQVNESACVQCGLCLQICPGALMRSGALQTPAPSDGAIGYSLAWSNDDSNRRDAASGGLVTGLVRWLLDTGACDGAVLVAADENRPLHSRTTVATSGSQVESARGSRYLPASACRGLKYILSNPGNYVFVGKGCEVSALRKAQERLPVLRDRVKLAIGLFCAQTPDRDRTGEFLRRHGVDPEDVTGIQFRGGGWPGYFTATAGARVLLQLPYRDAWDFLAAGTCALACFLCGDGRAANADISVGDPWGMGKAGLAGQGMSFVAARTSAGREILSQAAAAGAIAVTSAPEDVMRRSEDKLSLRTADVCRRRYTYSTVFEFQRAFAGFVRGRAAGIRTIVRQRFNADYY